MIGNDWNELPEYVYIVSADSTDFLDLDRLYYES